MKQITSPKILLVGASGSGKNTIQEYLVQKYGLKPLISYSTRIKRYPDECTHTFITEDEYEAIKETSNIIAYTYYQNNHYFATEQQLEESDIYIIDTNGIKYLKEHSDIPFVVFYLDVSELERISRMKNRGDSTKQIQERLAIDRKEFKNSSKLYDYVIENIDSQNTAETIYRLWQYEVSEYNKKNNILSVHDYSKINSIDYDNKSSYQHISEQEVISTELMIIDYIRQIQTLIMKIQPQIEHIEISVHDVKYGTISNNIDVFGCNYEYVTNSTPTNNLSFKTFTDINTKQSYLRNFSYYKNIDDVRIK